MTMRERISRRMTSAEERLSEIEKVLRNHAPPSAGRDYVSKGDWLPTASDKLKERGNDHPRAGVQRHQSK